MKFGKVVLSLALGAAVIGSAWAEKLKIATLPAADSIVLMVAQDEGLFAKEGLDVQCVPFKSALEVGAAMRAGKLAGHFGDMMNVFTQNETGAEQAVVVTTTHTHADQRAFGLVVGPKAVSKISSLADLAKTETAMSSSTIIDYLLDRMKAEKNLGEGALVNKEIRQIPIRLQMLLTGQIDTALLPEPLVSLVEKRGGRVIWDDTALNESLAVVALKKEHLDPKTVKGFRSAVAQAAAMIEKDPDKYRALMVKNGLLPKPLAKDYRMIRFAMFGQKDGLPPMPGKDEVVRVAEWMIQKGMIKSVPDYNAVIWHE